MVSEHSKAIMEAVKNEFKFANDDSKETENFDKMVYEHINKIITAPSSYQQVDGLESSLEQGLKFIEHIKEFCDNGCGFKTKVKMDYAFRDIIITFFLLENEDEFDRPMRMLIENSVFNWITREAKEDLRTILDLWDLRTGVLCDLNLEIENFIYLKEKSSKGLIDNLTIETIRANQKKTIIPHELKKYQNKTK